MAAEQTPVPDGNAYVGGRCILIAFRETSKPVIESGDSAQKSSGSGDGKEQWERHRSPR